MFAMKLALSLNRMTFASRGRCRRRGAAKSCGDCCAILRRARRRLATPRHSKITACSPKSAETRSRISRKQRWPMNSITSQLLFLIQVSRPIVWPVLPLVYALGLHAAHAELNSVAIAQMVLLTFPMNLIGCGLNDIYDYES